MAKTGLVVSCIVHAAVLAIPLSLYTGQRPVQEKSVELLIIDETPEAKSAPVETRRPPEKRSTVLTAVQPVEKPQLLPEAGRIRHVQDHAPLPSMIGQVIAQQPKKEPGTGAESPVFARVPEAASAAAIPALPRAPRETGIPELAAPEQEGSPIETVFGSAEGPDFIERTIPDYPRQALRLNREGTVLLMLTIDETGRLADIEIIEGAGYGLTEAAVEAVRNSTFRPATRNGNPVAAKAVLPIRFQIRR